MDNLTHSLLGAALAQACPQRWLADRPLPGRSAIVAAILAANAPDVDILLWPLQGFETYLLYRQGWTHGWAAMLLGALLVSTLVWGVYRRQAASWRALFAVALAAISSHLALDALTAWGLEPGRPGVASNIGLGLLFETDLVLLALLVLAPMLAWLGRPLPDGTGRRWLRTPADRSARWVLGAGLVYLVGLGGLRALAETRYSEARGPGPARAALVQAGPLHPLHWTVLSRSRRSLDIAAVHSLEGLLSARRVALNHDHPAVVAATAQPLVARFVERSNGLWWAEVRCQEDGYVVLLFDRRSASPWTRGGAPLVVPVHRCQPEPADATGSPPLCADAPWQSGWASGREPPNATCAPNG